MSRFSLVTAACSAVLVACATPYVDPGFVVRTDLRTTDCTGNPTPSGIGATPGDTDLFHFLTRREQPLEPPAPQPDTRPHVEDCTRKDAKVPVAAGLRLQRGDVLHLGTGAVGPAYQPSELPHRLHSPAALAAPVRVTLRSVNPASGRLYAEEDQLLAAAFSMAARGTDLKRSPELAAALDRRQALLWNTLMDHLRLWRMPTAALLGPRPSDRPALALLVDHASWCEAIKMRLAGDSATADRLAITRYFSGTDDACPGNGDPRPNNEFSRVTAPARSALQAVAVAPKASGGYFADPSQQAIYTQLAVDLKGARIGARDNASSAGAWTLADWQSAGICRDRAGNDLAIAAFRMRDDKWVHLKTDRDAAATVAVRLVFTQSLQARQFVETGHWSQRWKRVIEPADLDKLYARDIKAIEWAGVPAEPSMCLMQAAR